LSKLCEIMDWYVNIYPNDIKYKTYSKHNSNQLNVREIYELWITETRDEKINEILDGKER